MSSIVAGHSNPLPAVFSSQIPGRKKVCVWGGYARVESLSEKKAIRERREASLTERRVSVGFPQECHQHAGESCMSYNDGAAFATTAR